MGVLYKVNKYLNEAEKKDVRKKIMQFFRDNPNPPDKKVHDLADSLGIEPDKFEEHIYSILSSLLNVEKKEEGEQKKKD